MLQNIVTLVYSLYNVALGYSIYTFIEDTEKKRAFFILFVVVALHYVVGILKTLYVGVTKAIDDRYETLKTFRGGALAFSDGLVMPLALTLAALHVFDVGGGYDDVRYGIAVSAAFFGNALCLLDAAYGNSAATPSRRRHVDITGEVV